MRDVYLRSIEPLIVVVLGCMRRKGTQADDVRRRQKMIDDSGDNTRQETANANCFESLRSGRAAPTPSLTNVWSEVWAKLFDLSQDLSGSEPA